ncbi:hypothetical protein NM208_g11625 [Fusarium decemcellulare]|uniref:Uncharacterized protein n=1 Tax=Fusarium decemcellulare TaxID=57161 RepID=A0ACC1RRT3_9HYPO|nr:hypothetical protein NM208_g11625 [Fusarium decemcellulare]
MVRVAVAGGSGGLGRVITKAIADAGQHGVILLSREAKTHTIGVHDITSLAVDYSDVSAIAEVLRSNNVQVVISAIGVLFEDTHRAQINLIKGAAEAGTVARFAPSEFGIDYIKARDHGFPYPLPGLQTYTVSQYKIEAVELLKTTKMEYTRFIIGFLMDYYGFPAEPVPVVPLAVVLDVENLKAGIPGTGEETVTLTHSETIGRFVAASLNASEWPEKSWIIGDTVKWNEALKLAEQVRGQKFDVAYDTVESLRRSEITELPGNIPRYSIAPKPVLDGILSLWSLGFVEGWFDLTKHVESDQTVNDVHLSVPVLKLQEFLQRAWSK